MTTLLVIWTIAVSAAIVLALAIYLSAIAYYLYRAGGSVRSHLGQLAGGLVAIQRNAEPLGQRLAAVTQALAALRHELQAVDQSLTEAARSIGR